MKTILADRKILFGMTGSIAVCKAAGWVRELTRDGAQVTVVMTRSATRFLTPVTMAALSGRQVHSAMFDERAAAEMLHIILARRTDLLVVAPATAQTIARMAHGLADDLLTAAVLAARSPVLVFPAMNTAMYEHPATRANIARLREYGYHIGEPASGDLACGEQGAGRLVEWEAARETILRTLGTNDLAGRKVLVTAGPTREFFDPVRFFGNRSSGRMGYDLARVARRRGADVTLISGPVTLEPPPGVEIVRVTSAGQMRDAVMERVDSAEVVVKAAAVADYRPAAAGERKFKKIDPELTLTLEKTPDILGELGKKKRKSPDSGPLLVGFAAESHDHLAAGRRKLAAKNLDLIVINDILRPDAGFEAETNRITILDQDGGEEALPLLGKEECADRIWDRVVDLLNR